jgi:hypothetical protein
MAARCQVIGLLLRDADKYIAFLNFNTSPDGLRHSSAVNHAAKLGLLFLVPLAKACFHAPERSLASTQIVREIPNVKIGSELLYNQFRVLPNSDNVTVFHVPSYIIQTRQRDCADPLIIFRPVSPHRALNPVDIYGPDMMLTFQLLYFAKVNYYHGNCLSLPKGGK